MKHLSRWLLAGLLLGTFSEATFAAEQNDAAVFEVRARVDELFLRVLDADESGIDKVTCLADLLHARLRREEALGLVADATELMLVEDGTSAARAAVVGFVERLFVDGLEIEFIDLSRIAFFEEGDKGGEMLLGEGERELAISASGIVGLKMAGLPREVDVGVYRLIDRWCLDPLSMQ